MAPNAANPVDAAGLPFTELLDMGFGLGDVQVIETLARHEQAYRETGSALYAFLAFYEVHKIRSRSPIHDIFDTYATDAAASAAPLPLPTWAADVLLRAGRNLETLMRGRDPFRQPEAADTDAFWDWQRRNGDLDVGHAEIVRALGFNTGSGRNDFLVARQRLREADALFEQRVVERYAPPGAAEPSFESARAYAGIAPDQAAAAPETVEAHEEAARKARARQKRRMAEVADIMRAIAEEWTRVAVSRSSQPSAAGA